MRLTKSNREAMARALVKHKLAERGEGLCRESVVLFKQADDALYDPATKRLMAKLLKGHRKAFAIRNHMTARARGMYVRIGAQNIGAEGCFWKAETPYLPALHTDEDLSDQILGHMADFALKLKSFQEDVKAAYRKAIGTLGQFSTGKKLAADWPEAMPIIGKLIPEEDRSLPVVQLAAINAEFELPPSEAIAA